MSELSGTSEYLLYFINGFFPTRKVYGRNSPSEYMAAQRKWAIQSSYFYDPFLDLKDKVVLDAGCGSGGKTFYYYEKGCKSIVGIDLNEKSIANAKSQIKPLNAVDFQVASLAKLPFESDQFDVIIMDDVIEHLLVDDIDIVFQECRRVLKPNGKLIASFPPWTSNDAAHLYDYIRLPWCQFFFSDKTLLNVSRFLAKSNLDYYNSIEMQYYELNRLTISSSKVAFLKAGFRIMHFQRIPILKQNWFLSIPFFNQFLTKRVFIVLSK